ncbi:hypothetical protein ESCO_004487 [Escovopsis weberi]|uniref:Cell cycle control protein n=1 Tax=Escovopsis weberi TaxID=150374 RepID=A0A0M9VVQ7_ESCWE|nr:hypothetical protein ESCO_004487 [Escovopsis weberi]
MARAEDTVFDLLLIESDDDGDLIELDAPHRPPQALEPSHVPIDIDISILSSISIDVGFRLHPRLRTVLPPDSPTDPPQPARALRHPRRTNSQRLSPPRLSRSDSTVVGSGSGSGSGSGAQDADAGRPPPPPRREPTARHRAPSMHNYAVPVPDSFSRSWASLIGSVDFVRQLQHGVNPAAAAAAAAAAARSYAPARPPSPKPPMEPVPPARQGFTRDTCENPDDEMVVVCPSCNEELAYDPAESTAQANSRKRKRQPGEHHFWAIKKCGHVYCADCFENRRPSKTSSGAGFARASSSSPGPLDIRCSVDGCDTKVGNKSEWIGIYL